MEYILLLGLGLALIAASVPGLRGLSLIHI